MNVNSYWPWQLTIRPLQINSLFPVLDSGIFACGRAVHFHYFSLQKKVYLLLQYKCCTSVVYVIFDHVVYTYDKVCMQLFNTYMSHCLFVCRPNFNRVCDYSNVNPLPDVSATLM